MNKLTSKMKFLILLLGALLLYFLAFKMAFWETYSLHLDNQSKEAQLKDADELPQQIAKLEKAIFLMDGKRSKARISQESIQQRAIDFVTSFNGDVSLEETLAPVFVENDDYTTETVKVMLSGSYHDLLQLLYKLEFSDINGRIVSCSLESKEMKIDKSKKLFLNLYLQTIIWKR